MPEQTFLVCPKCGQQREYPFDQTVSVYEHKCVDCGSPFRARFVIVRAKNSRQSKKQGRRDFSLRVQNFDGSEDLIEFAKSGTEDLDGGAVPIRPPLSPGVLADDTVVGLVRGSAEPATRVYAEVGHGPRLPEPRL
jgi:hypothetical protein